MLARRTADNGVVYYVSPVLLAAGVRHGFSTRIGGTSPPPFDSLNLGNPNGCDVQDDYSRIWAHYRLLEEACDLPVGQPIRVHQAHGIEVARLSNGAEFDCSQFADAIVSTDPDRTISIRIADCVPILLARQDGSAVAAVHAGWRGVVGGVVSRAAKALLAASAEPALGADTLIAAIGPCIGLDAFEVGPEVIDEFRRIFAGTGALAHGDGIGVGSASRTDIYGSQELVRSADPISTSEYSALPLYPGGGLGGGSDGATQNAGAGGKAHVDLRACVKAQLLTAGLLPERIDSTDRCTFRNAEEFYSHRRERGRTGRMAALMAPTRLTNPS